MKKVYVDYYMDLPLPDASLRTRLSRWTGWTLKQTRRTVSWVTTIHKYQDLLKHTDYSMECKSKAFLWAMFTIINISQKQLAVRNIHRSQSEGKSWNLS